MIQRGFLALALVASVALAALVVVHPQSVQAASLQAPASCAQPPQIVPDRMTHKLVVTGQDTAYRSWMVKQWCPVRDASRFSAGLTRYVVGLDAKTACQQVVLGKPYTVTYTDLDGSQDAVMAYTGVSVFSADEHLLSTSPAGTSTLCPGRTQILATPWLPTQTAHVSLFSLALPQGGFWYDAF
jgi:hypothetical protein